MRVKITEVLKGSCWYPQRKQIEGNIFTVDNLWRVGVDNGQDTFGAWFEENPFNGHALMGFKYIEVPEPKNACIDQMRREAGIEPSQMSELGTLPELRFTFDMEQFRKDTQHIYDSLHYSKGTFLKNAMVKAAKDVARAQNYWYCDYEQKSEPKKLTWIQKIRGYDDLQARCNSAEAMREHYKTALESWESLAISKAREFELMTKVCDSWQQKAIDANKRADDFIADTNNRLDGMEQACQLMNDIMDDEEKIIGKRLKFSTHGLKFEITIGDPVTVCKFYHSSWEEGWFSIAKRNHKDKMDWRKAAVQSVENLCKEMIGDRDIQASIFEALFTAHPELK
jgi:hypothetical protein